MTALLARLALTGSLLVPAANDAAAPKAAAEDVFLLTGKYLLEMDGSTDGSALIYSKSGRPGYIVHSETLSMPVFVDPSRRSVRPVDRGLVVEVGDDGQRVLAGALGSQVLSDLVADGPTASFTVGGHGYRLVPAPHVLGRTTGKALLEGSPEYRRLAAEYEPAAADIERLRGTKASVQIDVFFGSWCGFCSRYMPRLMRVLDEAANPSILAVFHGVPRRITLDPGAGALGITAVPTAVIYLNGREIGRLEGEYWYQPEVALAGLLSRAR